jgi:folate-binding protein YgfZ
MLSDLNIYRLENELLLDFEPGLTAKVTERLEHYAIADDVQFVDVAPHYGLFSLQGPDAHEAAAAAFSGVEIPSEKSCVVLRHEGDGREIYLVNQPRCAASGLDLYVPAAQLSTAWTRLLEAASSLHGRACGWRAAETARIEAGIPRFGADMDETNLPPEAGLDRTGISYSKGCYIGQEVIARIRTYGHVAKALRRLRLNDGLKSLPQKGDKLLREEKEVGYITSAVFSPKIGGNVALGYVRREANQMGTELTLRTNEGETLVKIDG